jgi:HEAT repeat protein
MGLLQDPRAIPVLVKAMDDEDSQTVIFALYSIGNIGNREPVPQVIGKMQSQDPAIRMMCAYVLGALGDERAVTPLQGALSDESTEVTWNAALALARMHNPAGAGIVQKLMSRDYLAGFPTLSEPRKEELILNAITASQKLSEPQLDAQVRALSTSDPSLKVRDAALKALQ